MYGIAIRLQYLKTLKARESWKGLFWTRRGTK